MTLELTHFIVTDGLYWRPTEPRSSTETSDRSNWSVMRINFTDEEDRPGQFALWQANCRRSLQSKAGQASLRRLEAALLAMPEKALISGKLVDADGQVCALGQLAKVEGKLPALPQVLTDEYGDYDDDEEDTADFAEGVLGFPRLVAWKVVEQNDILNDVVWELAHGPLNRGEAYYRGPDGTGHGLPYIRDMTPEERYTKVLAWVRAQITKEGS